MAVGMQEHLVFRPIAALMGPPDDVMVRGWATEGLVALPGVPWGVPV